MKPTYIIAEAGLNHNGSVEIAKKLIDVANDAGADAVKFQKRTVAKLATKNILDAEDNRFPEFGKTYREIRDFIEFGESEYRELKEYTYSKEIDFMVTAFDIEAVDFLENLGVDSYKLASHSLTNLPLLEYVSKTLKPTIVSTGMSLMEDIQCAVNIFQKNNCPLSILHCVSSYPTPFDECNLRILDVLTEKFDVPVGYSGHEIGFLPTLSSVARGAKIVERHFTLDKNMVGFDHKLSLEPGELKEMIKQIRDIEVILGDGVKDVSETELITSKKYHVSMISSEGISKGTTLEESMIEYRNPGTGIPPKLAHLYFGKKAAVNIPADQIIDPSNFK